VKDSGLRGRVEMGGGGMGFVVVVCGVDVRGICGGRVGVCIFSL